MKCCAVWPEKVGKTFGVLPRQLLTARSAGLNTSGCYRFAWIFGFIESTWTGSEYTDAQHQLDEEQKAQESLPSDLGPFACDTEFSFR